MKTKPKQKIIKAFSFIETIASVFILAFGIVAVLPLLASSLRESIGSRDQMIAALLAQEGVEIMENLRDNNWTAGDGAFDHNFPSSNRSGCTVYYNSPGATCPGSTRLNLVTIGNNKYYTHGAGTATRFQRKLDFVYAGGNTELKVTSMVIWGKVDNAFPSVATCTTAQKCAYTEAILTDWHP